MLIQYTCHVHDNVDVTISFLLQLVHCDILHCLFTLPRGKATISWSTADCETGGGQQWPSAFSRHQIAGQEGQRLDGGAAA